ncbi:hypothetical protein EDC96DRAFT_571845 [Choanephora cucurbitarum]|nr:hypothetical protein EDC96DRAFT_571845 [Choanephora cucurbitarum]
MVQFAKESFNMIKNRNARCFAADPNKWLAIHNILKINKKMDSELSHCFDAAINEAMYRHFLSPPTRLSATLPRKTGTVGQVIEALVNLASQMMKVEKPVGESILESVWSHLFKVIKDYDPHRFDNSLFKKPHPLPLSLSLYRPDYAVEVNSSPSFVNLVHEVKPCSSAPDDLALDLYRVGIFSLALYERYGMESVISFHAKGLDATFYVTHSTKTFT